MERNPSDWKIGDIVQLKSGGPAMTIVFVGNRVRCRWFVGRMDHMDEFPREALQAFQEPIEAYGVVSLPELPQHLSQFS